MLKDALKVILGAGKVAGTNIAKKPTAAKRIVPKRPRNYGYGKAMSSIWKSQNEPRAEYSQLYEGHVPLGPVEKIWFTGKACALAIRDPHLRGDMVAAVAETTGEVHLRRLREIMLSDSVGLRILTEKPVLNLDNIKMDSLLHLEPDTVGGAFALSMKVHGLELGTRTPVRYVDDTELAYVMQRYREIHDVLHTIVGCPFSVSGELALKWFELMQTKLPMTALAAFAGQFARAEQDIGELKENDIDKLHHNHSDYIAWAITAGKESNNFMNVYLEECWAMKLVDFRRKHRIPKCPKHLVSLDMIWNGNPQPLIQHYQAAVDALKDDPDKGKRASVFLNAIEYMKSQQDK
uniref:Ubiquinone biosynthesis protein COQ4 homolog, mitochondrial n=1 Tax=Aplanochytrium stocchinoi TaxID=215587 RepID=A0A7S3UZQ1_9STRA